MLLQFSRTALMVLALGLQCGCQSPAIGEAKDGQWWVTLGESEHTAFVTGYLDCLDWANLPSYPEMSNRQLATSISNRYAERSRDMTRPASELLASIGGLTKRAPEANEEFGYSGDYWRQISSQDRRAYVHGFVTCASDKRLRKFSKRAESYVDAVSSWYGLTPDGEDMDSKRVNTALRDALLKFADDGK